MSGSAKVKRGGRSLIVLLVPMPFSCGDYGHPLRRKLLKCGGPRAQLVPYNECTVPASILLQCSLLALSTMTLRSTSDSSSIFENGKLKPGIYKIQNIQNRTYLDVEVHTREVCGRPTKDLEEGRGLVCRRSSQLFVSDDQKVGNQGFWGWIYGATGEHTNTVGWNVCHRTLRVAKHRLNLGNLNSFAP